MSVSGTSPSVHIDLGKDELGMTLQFRNVERDRTVWRDYTVDGEVVKSPVDLGALPASVYQLVAP